eukprot:gene24929-31327_t
MKNGKLDILTTIPVADIVKKGIPYLRSKFAAAEAESPSKWKKFWVYFITTWMKLYDPMSWNIHHLVTAKVELRNRTNNGLERYNRRFKALFNNPRPSMERFVSVIKEEAHRYLDRGEDIREGRFIVPPRRPVVPPVLPQEYLVFAAGESQIAEAKLLERDTRKYKLQLTREVTRQSKLWRGEYISLRSPLNPRVNYNLEPPSPLTDLFHYPEYRPGGKWQHDPRGRKPTVQELGRKPVGNKDNGYLISITDLYRRYDNWVFKLGELNQAAKDYKFAISNDLYNSD